MSQLPADWKSIPHTHSTQRMGDHFVVNGKHLVMKVPSVVVQGDYNFLLNPLHRDFNRIKILDVAPFSFDERLFVRLARQYTLIQVAVRIGGRFPRKKFRPVFMVCGRDVSSPKRTKPWRTTSTMSCGANRSQ